MNPISKQFGFYTLLITGIFLAISGDGQNALLCCISALFYEAIKQ